ncbi:class I SAM-dependent methyltransferase [Spiractinospora alimapuensis]|uniref:class I SAM-dependent methyltransferase n=1 Tax=Spiractinospora alimapuensis TaxID=2820884 RepID=UPI001F272A04|nr:class I SAM-dependent methyltransferase [Spiractinospora alimapuensis]QVQ52587.1 class I SAM-dependent methyltransferase [Spiractinospora alimapuensis]
MSTPAFARDAATAHYYDQRAEEYDQWYHGQGLFAGRERPGWHEEVTAVTALLSQLRPATTMDVACGTAFLTRHLPGTVTALDLSPRMTRLASTRLPAGRVLRADALRLPLRDGAVQRLVAGHFYGHLPDAERAAFLTEARRVARELLVVDSAHRPDTPDAHWQPRTLSDGSRHRVYKRYLTAHQLATEIHGDARMDGAWFVVAHARW